MSDTTTDETPPGDPAEAPQEDAPPARDPKVDALEERLRGLLGDAVVETGTVSGELCVRVSRDGWKRAVQVARDEMGFDYFCFLHGIDWLPNPTLGGRGTWDEEGATEEEEGGTSIETGVAGGDTRFQVFTRLYSTRDHHGITLKADLDDADPRVDSIVEVYRGADWHERETWEMYGFTFDGHPGLRHIYLPSAFEGFPGRKDFPLLSREVKPWPGLVDKEPIPGEDDEEAGEGGDAA